MRCRRRRSTRRSATPPTRLRPPSTAPTRPTTARSPSAPCSPRTRSTDRPTPISTNPISIRACWRARPRRTSTPAARSRSRPTTLRASIRTSPSSPRRSPRPTAAPRCCRTRSTSSSPPTTRRPRTEPVRRRSVRSITATRCGCWPTSALQQGRRNWSPAAWSTTTARSTDTSAALPSRPASTCWRRITPTTRRSGSSSARKTPSTNTWAPRPPGPASTCTRRTIPTPASGSRS